MVRPEFSLRGASGLETLISGAYIQIDPGPGSPQPHFVGLEQQPLITADEPGKTITLVTERLGGIDVGFGADGPEVRMESLQSLVFGGIAFETSLEAEQMTADVSDLLFTLHGSYREIEERAYIRKLNYVLFRWLGAGPGCWRSGRVPRHPDWDRA